MKKLVFKKNIKKIFFQNQNKTIGWHWRMQSAINSNGSRRPAEAPLRLQFAILHKKQHGGAICIHPTCRHQQTCWQTYGRSMAWHTHSTQRQSKMQHTKTRNRMEEHICAICNSQQTCKLTVNRKLTYGRRSALER